MILNIKQVLIRNFRSFGDYDTIVQIDGLGAALMVGENGAGKTTLVDSILWCLFGRIPNRDKPGDVVVNWFSGKDCMVQITTVEGWVITRTRGVKGHDDLLVHSPDGKDVSLSTNPNTQVYLSRIFNLDFDIFMSSVFFGQFGKPFLELPDLKRKKALERMLHLTKYDIIASVAKEKVDIANLQQVKATTELATADRDILRITQQTESATDDFNGWEQQREQRLTGLREELGNLDQKFAERASELHKSVTTAQAALASIKTYDLLQLEKDWAGFQTRSFKIESDRKRLAAISEEIAKAQTEKATLENRKADSDPTSQIQMLQEQQGLVQAELDNITLVDLPTLTTGWTKHKEVNEAIANVSDQISEAQQELNTAVAGIKVIALDIQRWQGKEGQICQECRQPISADHVHSMNNPSETRLAELEAARTKHTETKNSLAATRTQLQAKLEKIKPKVTLSEAKLIQSEHQSKTRELETIRDSIQKWTQQKERSQQEVKTRQARIKQLVMEVETRKKDLERKTEEQESNQQSLENIRPDVTIAEAEAVKREFDAKTQEIATIEASIRQLGEQKKQLKEKMKADIDKGSQEINPYQKMLTDLEAELNLAKTGRMTIEKRVNNFNTFIKHMDYIRTSYSDRKKIKAHTTGKLIPFLNKRIAYYLDALGSRSILELNAFLQIKTDKWPFDQHSGGERMRINLATMFAMYDLHTSIFEQRCNLLVLDEVDGKLDPVGIDLFVGLLYKEFIDNKTNGRPRAIIVISHKNEMRDAFPLKIHIKKEGDFTHIAEIA